MKYFKFTITIAALLSCTLSGVKVLSDSRYPFLAKPFDGVPLDVAMSSRNSIPILIAGFADEFFSINQLEVLNKAVKILISTAMTDSVIDCAFENSDRDFPKSRDKFIGQLYNVFTFRLTGDLIHPGHLYIAYFDSPENVVGKGYLDLFYHSSHPWPGYRTRRYTYIAINSRYLGAGSAYFYSTNPKYWAGVIAHEILHNLGYEHPNGYVGSFIDEYGDCIAGENINLPERLIKI